MAGFRYSLLIAAVIVGNVALPAAADTLQPRQTTIADATTSSTSSPASPATGAVFDAGTTGRMTIQTDTVLTNQIGIDLSTASDETAPASTSVSRAVAPPRETGFVLAAAAAVGLVGAVAAL
ncbi:hypothetical protein GGS23DRAFT_364166 [Durotheca rogersii]|uniref:uncharacterized protein n=1 Tax=Durotheca rogersii TaxID=419775 RepID=UPI0022210315|nr:uncharacterized protein GGS23DRAFT_364166 [Durotheca rogersii]KAI5866004.1 hypothetical protein GGS23DRAFT_364166 [Durotheca rogersii]